MTKFITIFFSVLGILSSFSTYSQNIEATINIEWKEEKNSINTEGINDLTYHYKIVNKLDTKCQLSNYIDCYSFKIPSISKKRVVIKTRNIEFSPNEVKESENFKIAIYQKEPQYFINYGEFETEITFFPTIRVGDELKLIENLSYSIEYEKDIVNTNQNSETITRSESLLSSGTWYKLAIEETGVFTITPEFLATLGINSSTLNPNAIRLIGKEGGLLPNANSIERKYALEDIAAYYKHNGDNSFTEGEFVSFYAEGSKVWTFGTLETGVKSFEMKENHYSDTNYVFLSVNSGDGLQMGVKNSMNNSTSDISTFYDFQKYEVDNWTDITKNVKSGSTWYGEEFRSILSENITKDFSFNLTDRVIEEPINIRVAAAARASVGTQMAIKVNNFSLTSLSFGVSDVLTDNYKYADRKVTRQSTVANSNPINVSLSYNAIGGSNERVAWLDFIELEFLRKLNFIGSSMIVRFPYDTLSQTKKLLFTTSRSDMVVWDITDYNNVGICNVIQENPTTYSFTDNIDYNRKYLVHNNSERTPKNIGIVPNQDVLNLPPTEYFIVTHPKFINQANELADFHRQKSKLNVSVVTTHQIYNELGSGRQDPTAIRDLLRYYYIKSTNNKDLPKYLLLFGDASYDPKYRVPNNTNYVTSYQSPVSENAVISFISDDYYGCLDDNEGNWPATINIDKLDLGIGRFPCTTVEEAQILLNKSKRYNSEQSMGLWRTQISTLADDEDNNVHLNQSETAIALAQKNTPEFVFKKYYADAYKEVSTSSGARYPALTNDLNAQINSGTLVLCYLGHGNPLNMGHERYLTINDVNNWNNTNNLTMFITGTCELSRFDDPERVSVGEQILLKSNGGGICMFTTSRVVYISENGELTPRIYNDNLLKRAQIGGSRFGDIIKNSKTSVQEDLGRFTQVNFTLLGDPGLQIATPKYKVNTVSINNQLVDSSKSDTLNALSRVLLKGEIVDYDRNKIKDFNGEVFVRLFDKDRQMRTLGNNPNSSPRNFTDVGNIIGSGKANVVNGEFEIQFILPLDLNYAFGQGSIRYYAFNDTADAHDIYDNIVVGGTNPEFAGDNEPPKVELWINDTLFRSGGITNENPRLVARISDNIGINTGGQGVGHEIVATLNQSAEFVVNDYFVPESNPSVGWINYPFSNLSDGSYHLKLVAWDVANNSGEAEIEFIVVSSNILEINKLINFPNPFITSTNFEFNHNQQNTEVDYTLDIYNNQGKMVGNLEGNIMASTNSTVQISWEGRDNNGNKLPAGIYTFRLSLNTKDGRTTSKTNKLVIIRD